MSDTVPTRLLACSALMVAAFAGCHLAGLRQSTSLLCDIMVYPSRWELFRLGAYLTSYLGVVLVAPILALAAALYACGSPLRRRTEG